MKVGDLAWCSWCGGDLPPNRRSCCSEACNEAYVDDYQKRYKAKYNKENRKLIQARQRRNRQSRRLAKLGIVP